jgi:phosphonate transport system substrate-binding protein
MLEPADLSVDNITVEELKNYVMVAKNLINQNADAGFFLKEAYENMSKFIKDQTKSIITSEISVIKHSFLISRDFIKKSKFSEEGIREIFTNMHENTKGESTLKSLSMTKWENQSHEDAEFMIDLMDTLI